MIAIAQSTYRTLPAHTFAVLFPVFRDEDFSTGMTVPHNGRGYPADNVFIVDQTSRVGSKLRFRKIRKPDRLRHTSALMRFAQAWLPSLGVPYPRILMSTSLAR